MGSGERAGTRASFNGANGVSDSAPAGLRGKQRASFNNPAAASGPSEAGYRFSWLLLIMDSLAEQSAGSLPVPLHIERSKTARVRRRG